MLFTDDYKVTIIIYNSKPCSLYDSMTNDFKHALVSLPCPVTPLFGGA